MVDRVASTRKLDGKTAIVTGASRGIGQAIAERLAEEGAQTVLCARDSQLLREVVARIQAGGGAAAAIDLDLRLPDTPARLVDFTLSTFGKIDIVVNNAGATKRGDFSHLTDKDWSDGFALKLFGAVRLARAAWPHLKTSSGSLVNIAGIGGRSPGAQFAIGGAVNAALLSVTKALAEKGIQDRVQVNAINPGTIRTARYQARVQVLAAERGLDLASAENLFLESEKISRVGEPADIAGLVAFLVSGEGRLFQGSLIDMDAGATKTI